MLVDKGFKLYIWCETDLDGDDETDGNEVVVEDDECENGVEEISCHLTGTLCETVREEREGGQDVLHTCRSANMGLGTYMSPQDTHSATLYVLLITSITIDFIVIMRWFYALNYVKTSWYIVHCCQSHGISNK